MLLYWLWLIFAAVFFYLAMMHWRYARTRMRPFVIRQRGAPKTRAKKTELDELIEQFVREFNGYLESMNALSQLQNRAAAVGYFMAGAIALASLFLALTGQLG